MRKIALLFLDTFLDANFNFLVFLGRPGRDPGHDPSWVVTSHQNPKNSGYWMWGWMPAPTLTSTSNIPKNPKSTSTSTSNIQNFWMF